MPSLFGAFRDQCHHHHHRPGPARSDTARSVSRLGPTRSGTELALVFHNNYYYHYCVHCRGRLLSALSVLSMTTTPPPITRRCDRKKREQTRICGNQSHACIYVFYMVHGCTQWHTTLHIVYNRGAVAICFGSKPSPSVYSTVSAMPVSFLGFRRDSIF